MSHRHRDIACPFCDEPAKVVTSQERKILHLGHKTYYPRTCVMGHEFYSLEYVPENYDYLVRQMRADLKQYRKGYNKKTGQAVRTSPKLTKEYRERMFREANKEGLIKIKKSLGQKLIKPAGRQDYYAENHDDRFKKYREQKVRERKKRRDEYLKGRLLAWYKDSDESE